MAPFAEPVATEPDELLNDRQYRVADALGLRLQLGKIDFRELAMPADFLGGLLRDDAEPRLRARQGGLKIEIFLHPVLVGEHAAHRLGREDVAEYRGIDQ